MDLHKPHSYDTLRQQMRRKRLTLNIIDRNQASLNIVTRLLKHPIVQQSQTIGGYLATGGEVNIQGFFKQAWAQSKQCYLPVTTGKTLLFASYTSTTELLPNRWGILEPTNTQLLSPDCLEAVIMPLVAFDPQGNRLGRGQGYYDRSFEFLRTPSTTQKPHLIGIGYTFQEVPKLTTHDWDIPMHSIITDTKSLILHGR